MPKIAILLHVFTIKLLPQLLSYISRLKYPFDLFINTYIHGKDKCNIENLVKLTHPHAHIIFSDNIGQDIGGFLQLINYIKINNLQYDYYLKLHSKTDDHWRICMLEAVLPINNIEKVFELLDKYNIVGSGSYLFKIKNHVANKDILSDWLLKIGLKESDIYNLFNYTIDKEDAELDELFYINHHTDLKKATFNMDIENKLFFARDHWKSHGIYEQDRCSHPKYLISKSLREYKFYAGTIFWITDETLSYYLENMEPIDIIYPKLERGYTVNKESKFTHSYEYWWGILSSHMNYPLSLKGIYILTFLVSDIEISENIEFKYILIYISKILKENYIINIQICTSEFVPLNEYKKRIEAYNIVDINKISIFLNHDNIFSNIYIISDKKTFIKGMEYENDNNIAFITEEIEYLYKMFKSNIVINDTYSKTSEQKSFLDLGKYIDHVF